MSAIAVAQPQQRGRLSSVAFELRHDVASGRALSYTVIARLRHAVTWLLRTPSEHGHYRVTYVELLFDLVFVFAITQLSHLLIEPFSLAAAGQGLLLPFHSRGP